MKRQSKYKNSMRNTDLLKAAKKEPKISSLHPRNEKQKKKKQTGVV